MTDTHKQAGPAAHKQKAEKVDLRLPAGMRGQVATQAAKDMRSTNAQIAHYVEMGLKGLDAETLGKAILKLEAAIDDIRRLQSKE